MYYDVNSIKSIEIYDFNGNIISRCQNKMQTYEIKSIRLARYLIDCGHVLANNLNSPIGMSLTFYDSQSLRDDIRMYENMSNIVNILNKKIDILLEAEKNYPEDIDDLNDYLGLICSINKLIKLRAIIRANMMCEKDMMSFVKKEKYLYPVIECYSDTGRDVNGNMIKYYMKYAKKKIEHVSYDNAMFDCC